METMLLSIRFLCSRSRSSSWNLVCCRKLTRLPYVALHSAHVKLSGEVLMQLLGMGSASPPARG